MLQQQDSQLCTHVFGASTPRDVQRTGRQMYRQTHLHLQLTGDSVTHLWCRAAPEQRLGGPVNEKADIHAFGVRCSFCAASAELATLTSSRSPWPAARCCKTRHALVLSSHLPTSLQCTLLLLSACAHKALSHARMAPPEAKPARRSACGRSCRAVLRRSTPCHGASSAPCYVSWSCMRCEAHLTFHRPLT